MDYLNDTLLLMRKLNAYAYSDGCPAELAARLTSIPGAQAEVVGQAAPILYAHFDLLNDQGREIMGLLFTYGLPGNQNWLQWSADHHAAEVVGLVEGSVALADAPPPRTELRDDGLDWRGPAVVVESATPPPLPA